jgi:chaperonin cofactor prefoldin
MASNDKVHLSQDKYSEIVNELQQLNAQLDEVHKNLDTLYIDSKTTEAKLVEITRFRNTLHLFEHDNVNNIRNGH